MLAVVFGLLFMALGVWGMMIWWQDFFTVMRGLMPVMIVCGGLLALIAGISGIKDSLNARAAARKNLNDSKQGS